MFYFLTLLLAASSPSLNILVEGNGHLRFMKEGKMVYAKKATLAVKNNKLIHESGATLLPSLSTPKDTENLEIDLEGHIYAKFHGKKLKLGRIVLALFPEGQQFTIQNDFWVSSSRPQLGNPGEQTNGVIRLEGRPFETVQNKITQIPMNVNIITSSSTKIKPTSLAAKKTESKEEKRIKPHIKVAELSEVENDLFTLGEIASIDADEEFKKALSQIVIGETPVLGAKRGINLYQIHSKLRAAHLKVENFEISLPSNAKITRKGQRVEHQLFVQKAFEFLKQQLGEITNLSCSTPVHEFIAPPGELELINEGTSINGSRINIVIGVYVHQKRINARTLTFNKEAAPIAIRTGGLVRITIQSNDVFVETTGRVQHSASIGQPIEVKTEQGALLSGILTNNNLVEVRL